MPTIIHTEITHPDDDHATPYKIMILNAANGLDHLVEDHRDCDSDCGQPLMINDVVIIDDDHTFMISHLACFLIN